MSLRVIVTTENTTWRWKVLAPSGVVMEGAAASQASARINGRFAAGALEALARVGERRVA